MKELDEETPKTDLSSVMTGLKALVALLGDQRTTMAYCFVLSALCQLIFLGTPFCLRLVLDELPTALKTGTMSLHLEHLLSLMAALPIVGLIIVRFIKEPKFLRSVITIENRLPMEAQAKLLALSRNYHERENTGKKISKINKGCDSTIMALCTLFWNVCPMTFYLLLAAAAMFWIDWHLAAAFFVPFIPMLFLLKWMFDRQTKTWHEWHEQKERSSGLMCQSAINVGTVQGYVQEQAEITRHRAVRERMYAMDLTVELKNQYVFLTVGFFLQAAYWGAMTYGIVRTLHGQTTLGALVFLASTGGMAINSLSELVMEYSRITRELVSIVRVKELLDQPVDVLNEAPGVAPSCLGGLFEFRQVKYRYPGKSHAVLDHFDLTITPGKMLALVGRSGAGKSTIAKLLARVDDVSEGELTLDGINVRELDRDWFRGLFAVVQQDVDIFDDTLRNNVAYGWPGAHETQVRQALDAAHLTKTVADLGRFPEGLKTEVGDRGVRLSGGERQRVGIARAYLAILHGARVLILDEATSSLDSEAERAIQEMLNRLRESLGVTIVAIAHRLSTIHHADQICVLEDGRVIEMGTHERLVHRNGLYAHLAELQNLGELQE